MITAEQLAQMFRELPEPEPVVLKLYYDDQGKPIVYTCDKLDGNYIEVDAETFALMPMAVKVVNGRLVHTPPTVRSDKLQPSNSGTMCHAKDVAVVVNDTGTYWKRKTYESS